MPIFCSSSHFLSVGEWKCKADVSQKEHVPPFLGPHVPVPVHRCGLSLLIMCSAATRPVSLILLIRETDTQSCAQRMKLQPFPTRHWGYGGVADEQNPEWCGCLGRTWCWTDIRSADVASLQPIRGKSVPHCSFFVWTFEGVSLLADSWLNALPHSTAVSRRVGKWKLWQSKTREVLPALQVFHCMCN